MRRIRKQRRAAMRAVKAALATRAPVGPAVTAALDMMRGNDDDRSGRTQEGDEAANADTADRDSDDRTGQPGTVEAEPRGASTSPTPLLDAYLGR